MLNPRFCWGLFLLDLLNLDASKSLAMVFGASGMLNSNFCWDLFVCLFSLKLGV